MSNPGAVGASIEQAYAAMPASPLTTQEIIKATLAAMRHLAQELESGQIGADLNASAYPDAIDLLDTALDGSSNQLGHVALAHGREAMGTAIHARRQCQDLLLRLNGLSGLMENLLETALEIGAHRQESQAAAAKYLTEIGVPHTLDKTA